ncbi:MAG: FecR domain-containing protein [Myxococcales bacterium]|jgi:transmembrane sensor
MLDERLKRARRELDAPPWDELRETRVLGRVLEEVDRGRRVRRTGRVFAGAALSAAAAAALWIVALPDVTPDSRPQPRLAQVPAPAVQASEAPAAQANVGLAAQGGTESGGSRLVLTDGSRAELGPEAEVAAVEQGPARVLLRQTAGRVRYVVTERPGREFVVEADEAEVRVLGTIFTVSVQDTGVTVEVERGRVAVSDPRRSAELTPGDHMFLASAPEPEPEATSTPSQEGEAGLAPLDDPRPAQVEPPSAQELMERADRARSRGQLGIAAQALEKLVRRHPHDPRAVSAWFTLGRVQTARGRHVASARAFDRCLRKSPRGSLAEDALAEAARAWAAAGRTARAHQAAADYLERYPRGTHARRMGELLER